MKTIAIQQPEHLPWLGFFNKMLRVDEYIFLDNVQFKKRYFENRNKIISTDNSAGWDWITAPVVTKDRFTQNINEVEIDYTQNWQAKYLNKIKWHYRKYEYFAEVFVEIEKIINRNFIKLLELNIALIQFVREYLNINTPTVLASEICHGRGSDLILKLCKLRRADVYLSGPDGRNYLNLPEFQNLNIQVEYHDYAHPQYEQQYDKTTGNFISHLSVLDLLFNCGRNSIEILKINY